MALKSSTKVSSVKATLPYPVFAADFDPYSRGYLVVGGGGGESKTGVPNQISVLDISDRAQISVAADIDLSRDEDSVQSLANLATDDGLIVFAGINSSQADQNAGKNEHLRSFQVTYPPRKKQRTEKVGNDETGQIKPLSRKSIFNPSASPKKETYQRLLRLSPAQKLDGGNKRIGVIATGLTKRSEVVVFDATTPTPLEQDIITRIALPEGTQAEDLDLCEPETSTFSVAYCTDYDIYEQTYQYDFATKKAERTPNGPRRIHQMPFPDTMQDPKSRLKFRALRYLNPQNIVALCNRPNKAGAELRIFHLYPTGPATLLLQKSLPSHVRQAMSLDVCALDKGKDGNQQVAVAVAAQDVSIEIYTTNFQRATETYSAFTSYLTLKAVHPQQMTKICFSPFHSPRRAPDPEPSRTGPNGEPIPAKKTDPNLHPGPQYIRLASVSYGNTVVVNTFPLSPLDPTDKNSRYVLNHPDDATWAQWTYIGIISLIVLVAAFMIQSFATGFSGEKLGPFSLLPRDVRDFLDQPAQAAYGLGNHARASLSSAADERLPSNMPGKGRLRELLATHTDVAHDASGKAFVIRQSPDGEGGVSVDVHEDKAAYRQQDTDAKHWHELEDHQKAVWKERLIRAGEWTEGEGEKVLLSILFSEYAGLVGQVAREAVGGG